MESWEMFSHQKQSAHQGAELSTNRHSSVKRSWFGKSCPNSLPQKGTLAPGNTMVTNLANSIISRGNEVCGLQSCYQAWLWERED